MREGREVPTQDARVLAIIPRDGDVQGVKKICSKFGRVLSCLEVIDNGNRGALLRSKQQVQLQGPWASTRSRRRTNLI